MTKSISSPGVASSVQSEAAQSAMRNTAAGDLMSGRAFDNGCICQIDVSADLMDSLLRGGSKQACRCCAPQLQPEMEFVNALMNIGIKLGTLGTKEQKSEDISQV